MTTHEPGTVVMLKSGGPKMTVEGTDDEGELTCVWFVSDKTKRDSFPSITLKAVAEASDEDER
jgi:uncharacterized protein YodC (DUF2158 family)